tara:strand:- start:1419 stop:1622 length:204 start_codon:yes stop_codon:yes gene_type:complete
MTKASKLSVQRYKLTACCPNETVAESFVEYWTRKGYTARAVEEWQFAKCGQVLGAWSVYRTTKKVCP